MTGKILPNTIQSSVSLVLVPAAFLFLSASQATMESDFAFMAKTIPNLESSLGSSQVQIRPNQIQLNNKELVEQELSSIINMMIARQIPPDHELDSIIEEDLWELYDHGF